MKQPKHPPTKRNRSDQLSPLSSSRKQKQVFRPPYLDGQQPVLQVVYQRLVVELRPDGGERQTHEQQCITLWGPGEPDYKGHKRSEKCASV